MRAWAASRRARAPSPRHTRRARRTRRGSSASLGPPAPCELPEHVASRLYTGSITIHGYVGALTYPWGVNVGNPQSLDHNTYDRITRNAAAINGYRHGTSTDIVYPVDGAYEDYVYWKHGIWSLLVELKDGSKDDIEKTSDAMYSFLEALDSSPSTKNQLTSACNRAGTLDLMNE